jgi:drug/metabolite transporter (DMT)-like permease
VPDLKKINPKLIVIIGVIFVSFSSILVKASSAPALIISTYRLAFTVILITPSALIKCKKEFKEIKWTTLLLSAVGGILLALHFATWITSIKYTSIASSTVLVNTHPIFIVALTWLLFREKQSKRALFSIGLTILGGAVISSGDNTLGSNVLYGDMLAVLGAAFVSGYMLIGRIIRQKLSVTAYTLIVYLSCTLTLLTLNLITSTPLYPYSLKEFAIFLALAVCCTILGHSIFNWSLEYVKPTFLSVSMLGEPVFATIWAIFIFAELPTLWNVVGSVMILWGIYIFSKAENAKK